VIAPQKIADPRRYVFILWELQTRGTEREQTGTCHSLLNLGCFGKGTPESAVDNLNYPLKWLCQFKESIFLTLVKNLFSVIGNGFQKAGRWKLVAKQKVPQMRAFTIRKSVCLRGQFPVARPS